jgi:hypothetical protein
VYLLIGSSLGLSINASERRILLRRATLPGWLDWIRLERLSVGQATVDLLLERHEHDVGVRVLRRSGDVEIVTVK